MSTDNDKIQFRGAEEKRATRVVDEMRLGGINVSELARRGLQEKLRETLSDEEKRQLYRQYESGELDEAVARILVGDAIEEIERERAAFEDAKSRDTDGVFRDE